MAANLINPFIGGINRVLVYIHVPILDTVEVPWNSLIYQINAEIVLIIANVTGKVITDEGITDKIIKDNNETCRIGLVISKVNSETRLTIRISPIILVTFITVSLGPEVIEIINKIQKHNDINKMAVI